MTRAAVAILGEDFAKAWQYPPLLDPAACFCLLPVL
ncbi:hypothetical protein [Lactobacillus delbrueckii]